MPSTRNRGQRALTSLVLMSLALMACGDDDGGDGGDGDNLVIVTGAVYTIDTSEPARDAVVSLLGSDLVELTRKLRTRLRVHVCDGRVGLNRGAGASRFACIRGARLSASSYYQGARAHPGEQFRQDRLLERRTVFQPPVSGPRGPSGPGPSRWAGHLRPRCHGQRPRGQPFHRLRKHGLHR